MPEVIVGVCIAVVGWLVTHFSRLHFEKRAAQLSRVNDQLENLYGPLTATLTAGDETWASFSKKYWPAHGKSSYFGQGKYPLTEEELERWRTWVVAVFQPRNDKIEKIIVENIHLIEGEKIPISFTEVLAHVSAYRAVIAQWENGKYEEHLSVNIWPSEELRQDVIPIFKDLSKRQARLLGKDADTPLKKNN